jgi:hypothetical protein
MRFKHIDAGNQELWAVNSHNEVYIRQDSQNQANPSQVVGVGSSWKRDCGGIMIFTQSAEQGVVWALDDENDVWVLKAGTISVETVITNDPDWTLIADTKLVYVDVGRQGQLVGLAESGCSFWRRGIT